MTTKLTQAILGLQAFTSYRDGRTNENLKHLLNVLGDELRHFNRFNVEAQVPVMYLRTETTDIGGLSWSDGNEGYEIISGTRRDKEGNEFSSFEEYKKFRENESAERYQVKTGYFVYLDDTFDEVYDGINGLIHELRHSQSAYEERDFRVEYRHYIWDNKDDVIAVDDEGYESQSSAEQALEELLEEDTIREDYDDLEFHYDEVMWNTVYQFGGAVDYEVAAEVGLAVIRINLDGHEYEGQEFLALTGCGMDLSPLFVAYKALVFGAVDREDAEHFGRKRKYFEQVVGSDTAKKVYSALGLTEVIRREAEDRVIVEPVMVNILDNAPTE